VFGVKGESLVRLLGDAKRSRCDEMGDGRVEIRKKKRKNNGQ
jgi:hypothetical protein